MKLSHQASTVLQHMRQEPFITSWAAEGVYRIRRLASRIDELAAKGFEIEKQTARDRTGQRYTRYSLSQRQRRRQLPVNPPRTADVRLRMSDVERVVREHASRYCLFASEVTDLLRRIKETA